MWLLPDGLCGGGRIPKSDNALATFVDRQRVLDCHEAHDSWSAPRIHKYLQRTHSNFSLSERSTYRVLNRGTAAVTGHGSSYVCSPYKDRIIELLRGNPDDGTKLRDGTRADRHHIRAIIPILTEEEKSHTPLFSLTALHSYLTHINLKWRLRRRGPAITANNRLQRIEWWRTHRGWTFERWQTMVFTDSVALSPDYSTNRHNDGVWILDGDSVPPTQKHRRAASVLHCYGALTRWGLVGPFFIVGSINGVTYRRKILKPMLAAVAALFALHHDADNFVWQQDGAAAHKDGRTQDYLAANSPAFIGFRDWPGNSPDISPIEQVWPLLSAYCAPYGSFGVSHEQLKERATRFFADFPAEACQKLLRTSKKRMRLLENFDWWAIPE